MTVALIEAKAESPPPDHGLEDASLHNRSCIDPYAFKCTDDGSAVKQVSCISS